MRFAHQDLVGDGNQDMKHVLVKVPGVNRKATDTGTSGWL
jgi:hypothetical protein